MHHSHLAPATLEEQMAASRRAVALQEERLTPEVYRGVLQAVIFSPLTHDLMAAKVLREALLPKIAAQRGALVDWQKIELVPPLQYRGSKSLRFDVLGLDLLGRYTAVISFVVGGDCGDGMRLAVRREGRQFIIDEIQERWKV